jgi:phenylacetate-CoA ligase
MLDSHAVIALPRYATGDLGRLVSPQESAQAAAMAGTATPWLPLVAIQGRIKDRPVGLPSVESIKELLYLDHAIANQLSGAFRLARNDHGSIQLMLQANSAAAVTPALHAKLMDLCARHGFAELEVKLVEPQEFPWRPLLDYERKFAYVAAAPG